MSSQLDLLLQMVGQTPSRFEAFLAQMNLLPEEAKTLQHGLDEGASPEAARAAASTLAERIWTFLDDDQTDPAACPWTRN